MPFRPPIHQPFGDRPRKPAYEADRGSTAARGYDRAWQRARLAHLAREPLCRFCLANGLFVAAVPVDHIEPIATRPDLRLVDSNLRSLCTPCHNALTARQRAG